MALFSSLSKSGEGLRHRKRTENIFPFGSFCDKVGSPEDMYMKDKKSGLNKIKCGSNVFNLPQTSNISLN